MRRAMDQLFFFTGPNAWATGTYVNSTSVADNGTADTGVSLTLVTAGNWAGAGKSPLLDDYANLAKQLGSKNV